jgi:hypothetical protein
MFSAAMFHLANRDASFPGNGVRDTHPLSAISRQEPQAKPARWRSVRRFFHRLFPSNSAFLARFSTRLQERDAGPSRREAGFLWALRHVKETSPP